MVLMLIICFTSGRDPIPDYAAPMDTAYYAANLGELEEELENNSRSKSAKLRVAEKI